MFFENTNVREVSRTLNSSGEAFLLIETQASLEEQIAKKSSPQLYLVSESDLEESARTFLRKFIPEQNSVPALLHRMDQEAGLKQSFMAELEIEVSKLAEDKMKIQSDFQQFQGHSPDHQVGNQHILKENLEIRERNHELILQVTEHRRRVRELNDLVA